MPQKCTNYSFDSTKQRNRLYNKSKNSTTGLDPNLMSDLHTNVDKIISKMSIKKKKKKILNFCNSIRWGSVIPSECKLESVIPLSLMFDIA